jgi:SnoaL-like domain
MDQADDFSDLMQANVRIFSERDAAVRRELMTQAYAEGITFTDPEGTVVGYEAVSEQVQKLLSQAPESFAFTPDGPLYANGTGAARPWKFGPSDGLAVARGVDVTIIADRRITSLSTFVAP